MEADVCAWEAQAYLNGSGCWQKIPHRMEGRCNLSKAALAITASQVGSSVPSGKPRNMIGEMDIAPAGPHGAGWSSAAEPC